MSSHIIKIILKHKISIIFHITAITCIYLFIQYLGIYTSLRRLNINIKYIQIIFYKLSILI